MDTMGIAHIGMDMKTMMLQSEMSTRVMKMAMDVAEQGAEGFFKMIDSILTGTGKHIDIYA